MSEAMVVRVVGRLSALADPVRVRIVHRLQKGEADVSTLVQATGAGQASVSKHLAVLRQAGWVESRRVGTRVVCSVADPAVYDICKLLCDGVVREAKRTAKELGV